MNGEAEHEKEVDSSQVSQSGSASGIPPNVLRRVPSRPSRPSSITLMKDDFQKSSEADDIQRLPRRGSPSNLKKNRSRSLDANIKKRVTAPARSEVSKTSQEVAAAVESAVAMWSGSSHSLDDVDASTHTKSTVKKSSLKRNPKEDALENRTRSWTAVRRATPGKRRPARVRPLVGSRRQSTGHTQQHYGLARSDAGVSQDEISSHATHLQDSNPAFVPSSAPTHTGFDQHMKNRVSEPKRGNSSPTVVTHSAILAPPGLQVPALHFQENENQSGSSSKEGRSFSISTPRSALSPEAAAALAAAGTNMRLSSGGDGLDGMQKIMESLHEAGTRTSFSQYQSAMPSYAHIDTRKISSASPTVDATLAQDGSGELDNAATAASQEANEKSEANTEASSTGTIDVGTAKWRRKVQDDDDPLMLEIVKSMETKLSQSLAERTQLENLHDQLSRSKHAFEESVPKLTIEQANVKQSIEELKKERDLLMEKIKENDKAVDAQASCVQLIADRLSCQEFYELFSQRAIMARARNDLLLYQMQSIYSMVEKVKGPDGGTNPSNVPGQHGLAQQELNLVKEVYFHAKIEDQCRMVFMKSFAELAIHKDLPRLAKGVLFWDEPRSSVIDLWGNESQTDSVRRILYSLASRFDSIAMAVDIRKSFQPPVGDLSKYLLIFLQGLGGDDKRSVRILKAMNQCVVAPFIGKLKMAMEELGLGFNSKRNGWQIMIAKEASIVCVQHRKSVEASPSGEDYFGKYSFDWLLEFSFDDRISTLLSVKCSLDVESVQLERSGFVEADVEEFKKIIKDTIRTLEYEDRPLLARRVRKLKERKLKHKTN